MCPICKIALVDAECPRCHGNWLTIEKLDAMLSGAAKTGTALTVDAIEPTELPPNLAAKHKRDCPVCATLMASGTLLGVLVDRCRDHGVWVDPGEMSRIVLAARRHDRR